MSTMKYTPGPWRIAVWDYLKAEEPRKDLVIQNDTNRIAVLDWDEGKENPYTIPEPQAMANARLIAAAPRMLAAIKSVVDLYENNPDDLETLDQGVILLRAAIAEAIG